MNSNGKTFIAALSGGVDSSVAASIAIEQGNRVIGVTLKMKSCDDSKEKAKSCCGIDDNIQAKLIADKLDIPHYFLDVREKFTNKILNYAWSEYKKARTPNPCVMCNFYLKFGALMEFAKDLGADGIITGHYAIIKRDKNGKASLFKGLDDQKNQTYFLAGLSQEQLNYSYMPLGELTKNEVRKIAAQHSFANAQKQESQDACFGYIGETFQQTLSRFFNEKSTPGNILDDNNKVIGKHNGIEHYTIGQRKGLGIALGKPAYIRKIDIKTNNIYVSTNSGNLMCSKFTAVNMNWLDFNGSSLNCSIQTRYRQPPESATVHKLPDDTAVVELKTSLRAVTPGQVLAVYDGNQLIAGGWINELF